MPSISTCFHLINASVCFALSCLFNGALLWLLAHRTTAKMTTYRPILLLCTWVDLVYSAVLFVVRPVLITGATGSMYLSTGPLRWMPQPYNFALIAAFLLCRAFSIYSVAAPFLFRYFFIVWDKKWGLREFLAILLLPVAASVALVVVMFPAGYTWTEEDQQRARKLLLVSTNLHSNATSWEGGRGDSANYLANNRLVVPYFVADRTRNRPHRNYTVVSYPLTYAVVVYCGWRIYRHLTHMAVEKVNERHYRALQNQLSTALLLQAVVPLVVGFMPLLVIYTGHYLGLEARLISFHAYSTAIYAWTPVANAVITLWVIKAYRDTVQQWVSSLWEMVRPRSWHISSSVYPAPMVVVEVPRGTSQRHPQQAW